MRACTHCGRVADDGHARSECCAALTIHCDSLADVYALRSRLWKARLQAITGRLPESKDDRAKRLHAEWLKKRDRR